jgi:hypothetical protein
MKAGDLADQTSFCPQLWIRLQLQLSRHGDRTWFSLNGQAPCDCQLDPRAVDGFILRNASQAFAQYVVLALRQHRHDSILDEAHDEWRIVRCSGVPQGGVPPTLLREP